MEALSLISDDDFTKNLLDEVDRMGIEGQEDLRRSEDVVDVSEPLKRQLDILKTELKKQRLMQIHSFKHQRGLEEELKAAQERGKTLAEALMNEQSGKNKTEDSDNDNDTVATVETELSTVDLRERLTEVSCKDAKRDSTNPLET